MRKSRKYSRLLLGGCLLIFFTQGAFAAVPHSNRQAQEVPNIMVNRFGAPPKRPSASKPVHKLEKLNNQSADKSHFNAIAIPEDYFTRRNLKYAEVHKEMQAIINDKNIRLPQINALIAAHKNYMDDNIFEIEPSFIDSILGNKKNFNNLSASDKERFFRSKEMLHDHVVLNLKKVMRLEKQNGKASLDSYRYILDAIENYIKYLNFSGDKTDEGIALYMQNLFDEYNAKYQKILAEEDKSYKIFNYNVPSWITNSFSKLSSWLDF